MKIKFKRVAIIGVGLIGGSFARNCRRYNLTEEIIGYGRSEENLREAKELGLIDSYHLDPVVEIERADFILLATPVNAIIFIAKQIIPFIKDETLLTDVGSIKLEIVKEIYPIIPDYIKFIGGHPIAGTENSGVKASFTELFCNAKCILTETPQTDKKALKTVKEVWEICGSEVIIMDPEHHDIIMAAVSHIPHIAAYSLVNALSVVAYQEKDIFSYAGGGFKDFSRIASSSPAMWKDICMLNKDNILQTLSVYIEQLEEMRRFIKEDNFTTLEREFFKAKDIRDSIKTNNKMPV